MLVPHPVPWCTGAGGASWLAACAALVLLPHRGAVPVLSASWWCVPQRQQCQCRSGGCHGGSGAGGCHSPRCSPDVALGCAVRVPPEWALFGASVRAGEGLSEVPAPGCRWRSMSAVSLSRCHPGHAFALCPSAHIVVSRGFGMSLPRDVPAWAALQMCLAPDVLGAENVHVEPGAARIPRRLPWRCPSGHPAGPLAAPEACRELSGCRWSRVGAGGARRVLMELLGAFGCCPWAGRRQGVSHSARCTHGPWTPCRSRAVPAGLCLGIGAGIGAGTGRGCCLRPGCAGTACGCTFPSCQHPVMGEVGAAGPSCHREVPRVTLRFPVTPQGSP